MHKKKKKKQFCFQFHMQTIPARKEMKWPVERRENEGLF